MSDFLEQLEKADLVLVGLGEEFDGSFGSDQKEYETIKEQLSNMERFDLIPIAMELYRKEQNEIIKNSLQKLKNILDRKNYFIVSTSLYPLLSQINWREGRIVKPCGNLKLLQCSNGCEEVLQETDAEILNSIHMNWNETPDESKNAERLVEITQNLLGKCSNCGSSMIFNTIYADKYNEAGYLKDWQTYMTWLQGTIHKSVLILELGVSMKYPSVIRFPFEKVAFYNEKAMFYRVNEKLYHMTEELHDKGISVKSNVCDWILQL